MRTEFGRFVSVGLGFGRFGNVGFDTKIVAGVFTELKLLPPTPEVVGCGLHGL